MPILYKTVYDLDNLKKALYAEFRTRLPKKRGGNEFSRGGFRGKRYIMNDAIV